MKDQKIDWSEALDAMEEGIIIIDTEHGILSVNKTFAKMVGMPREGLVGRRCYEVVHGRDAPIVSCPLGAALETKKTASTEIKEPHLGEGTFLLAASPVLDDKKDVKWIAHAISDITERKRAEETLRESEETYSTLVEEGNDGIVIIQDGLLKFLNSTMNELSGLTLEKVIGKSFIDFVSPESRELVMKRYKKRISGEEVPRKYEIEILSKDGRGIPVEVNASSIEYEGRPADMAIVRDITERKKAEEALKKSESHLRNVLDGLGPYMLAGLMTPDGTLVEANRPALKIAGLKPEDVLGKPFEETYWWSYSKSVKKQLRDAIRRAAKGETCRYDVVLRVGKNRFITIDFCLQPLVDEAGRIIYLVPSAIDITGRKRAEDDLRKVNRALKTLSECNQGMVCAKDVSELMDDICRIIVKDGGYRLAWVGFAEQDEKKTVRPVAQVGYEEGYLETVNITWADTKQGHGPTGRAIRTGKPCVTKNIPKNPNYAPWRAEAAKRGYASSIALPLVADAQTIGALNIYAVEPDAFDAEEVKLLKKLADNLAYGIVTLHTHAERKKAEEKLRTAHEKLQQAYEELRSLDELKSNIISNVSHELRTPITIAKGFLELAVDESEKDKRDGLLKKAVRALVRQNSIVGNLIDAAYMDKGDRKFKSDAVDLAHIIALVSGEFESLADRDKIKMEINVEKDLPMVRANHKWLRHVLRNLLNNAIKFNKKGGEISIEVGQTGKFAKISITDSGIGIAKEHLPKVFDRFYQADASSSRAYGGTGLGLAVVKEMIEVHGGTISVESEPGKGAKFCFTLPLAKGG